MNQALKRVFRKASAVTRAKDKSLSGYGFNQQGACLWGTYLKAGGQNTLTTYLETGTSYFFVGAGDDYVRNVDVLITDSKGSVVAKDTEEGKEAGVLFKPRANGSYRVLLRLKAADRFGLCAIACLRRPNGWILNQNKFVKTVDVFRNGIQQWGKHYKGKFLHNGQWSLVMGVLEQGEILSWTCSVPPCSLGVTTAHDGAALDLDLFLNTPGGKTLVSATLNGSTPGLTYRSPNGGSYHWRLKATGTKEPCLVAVALLELPRK